MTTFLARSFGTHSKNTNIFTVHWTTLTHRREGPSYDAVSIPIFPKKWLWNLSSKSTRTLTSPYRTCRTASSSPNRLHRLGRASRSATTSWTSPSSPPPVSSTVRFSRTAAIPSFRFVLVTYRSQSFILIRARCSATKRCRFDSLNIEKMNKSACLSLIRVEIFLELSVFGLLIIIVEIVLLMEQSVVQEQQQWRW